jgi:hypothetical protein
MRRWVWSQNNALTKEFRGAHGYKDGVHCPSAFFETS